MKVEEVVEELRFLVRDLKDRELTSVEAQQLRIIEVLTRDLNLGVEIVPCAIMREPDGLALSSRNAYLTPQERRAALCLHQALELARQRVAGGERDAMKLTGMMAEHIGETPSAEIDYVAIVDPCTLEDLKLISGEALAAVAVMIGKTRLIDNERLNGVME